MEVFGGGGVSDYLSLGGMGVKNPWSRMKQLAAQCAANGGWSSLRSRADGTTGPYQVPVGKQFRILMATVITGSQPWDPYLGYGDTAVNQNSASPPTNQTYFGGSGVNQAFSASQELCLAAANTVTSVPLNSVVPAGKYPVIGWSINNVGSISAYGFIYVWGIEEDV